MSTVYRDISPYQVGSLHTITFGKEKYLCKQWTYMPPVYIPKPILISSLDKLTASSWN